MNERTDSITFDPAALSERQLDGLACVACGAVFAPGTRSVPAGEVLGAQVFACASHAADEPMSLDAIERDVQRTAKRLLDAIDAHNPAELAAALKAARPAIDRAAAAILDGNTR